MQLAPVKWTQQRQRQTTTRMWRRKRNIANPVKGPDGAVVFGWYVDFLKHIALPNVDVFNVLVPWGETLIGLGLILGCLTTTAMFFGLVMNFSFFLAGTVSHNPRDIFLGFIILTAGYNAGKIGLDRWVVPYFRKMGKKGTVNVKNKTA